MLMLDTLQPLLEDVRERLRAAQQTWQQNLEGEANAAAAFRARIAAAGEAVAPLRSAPLGRLLEAIAGAAAALPDSRPADTDFLLAEMASAFLHARFNGA